MTIARRHRPRTALLPLALIVLGAGLLGACQSTVREAAAPAPETVAAGWQVIERLGDARWRAAGTGPWAPAMPATTLPAGSQLATGQGGRLIAARAATHVSAGPDSRFSLPAATPQAPLEQRAGRLRYRIAEAAPERLVVATEFLEIAPAAAVFDVIVTPTATEVAVERGSVRIATPDGLRHIELSAGQSAYAGDGEGQELGFRKAPGQPLEPVAPLILAAMHPRVSTSEGRAMAAPRVVDAAASQASTSGAAASEAAVAIARADGAATAASRRATALAPPPREPVPRPGLRGVVPAGLVRSGASAEVAANAATARGTDAGDEPFERGPAEPRPTAPVEAPSAAPAAVVEGASAAPPDDRAFSFDRLTAGMLGQGPRPFGAPATDPAPARP